MAEPSIKGSIFRGVVEDVLRYRDEGRIAPDQIEAALEPRDLEILEAKILDASWYPIPTYARLLELLCRTVGGGRRSYYVERGEGSAQRLLDAGMYSQLDLLGRWDKGEQRGALEDEARIERAMQAYESKLKLVVSLAGAIYNVGRWTVGRDPEVPTRSCIDIHEASAYSEGMQLAIEGFLNRCARVVKRREPLRQLFRSERPAADHIRIRMTMDVPELFQDT